MFDIYILFILLNDERNVISTYRFDKDITVSVIKFLQFFMKISFKFVRFRRSEFLFRNRSHHIAHDAQQDILYCIILVNVFCNYMAEKGLSN